MQQMKREGNRVPRFCFWAFNGPVITVVQDLYDRIYKTRRYSDLWFYWEGKPLLLYNGNPKYDASGTAGNNPNPHYDPAAATDPSHPHYGEPDYTEPRYKDYTSEVKRFFTLRTMWWGYKNWGGAPFIAGALDTILAIRLYVILIPIYWFRAITAKRSRLLLPRHSTHPVWWVNRGAGPGQNRS